MTPLIDSIGKCPECGADASYLHPIWNAIQEVFVVCDRCQSEGPVMEIDEAAEMGATIAWWALKHNTKGG